MLTKNRRENLLPRVKEARKIVEDAFDRALVGLGLPKDRDPLPSERLTNPDKQKIRKAVDEVIARDREAGGMSYVDARRRYLEHCAFTLVNRIAALRAMEVRGFLPKSVIAQDAQYGGLSAWGRDILEAGCVEILGKSVPVRTADEARWQAIRAACVAASRDVAIVFDLQDEYSLLVPEPAAIKGLVVELTETVTTDDWAADDILGWVYQYYNVPANADYKERKKRPHYKMTADDMIVANQFYTPHWVVRVLVDNTLGRIWWESIPDLARKRLGEKVSNELLRHEEERLRQICRETCAYLVPMPDEQRLGWWGEEAKSNAEARAAAEARKRFDAAAVKPEVGPSPPPPIVPPRSWKPVRELKIIDPACGSAHFLLYVFDVLRRMYETEPKSDRPNTADVPNVILAENLHGIDVDLRACQLGTFNLYLKARLAFREITGRDAFHPSKLNIVCAGARITEGEERAELLASFDSTPLARELAEGILNNLSKTAEIGSLLKVREQFEPLLRRQRLIQGKPVQSSLFGGTPAYQRDFFADREIEELSLPQVLDRLKGFESEARPRGDVGKLLFAHEMAKSCGMVDLLTQTYDVALMNPPYGKMPEACRDYCKGNPRRGIPKHYPNTGNNLYSAFIDKCIYLVANGSFVGLITSQTFMHLGTFKKTRQLLNQLAPPELLCDTGYDVLDGAKVITATTVLRKKRAPNSNGSCLAIRMSQESEEDKEAIVVDSVEALKQGRPHARVFVSSVEIFQQLPTSVYSYWVPPKIAELFALYPPLDRDVAKQREARKIADSKVGLQTGDNPRFVRFYWEVSQSSIAPDPAETQTDLSFSQSNTDVGKRCTRWVPFTTGGWLNSFQDDLTCVVDWTDDGEALCDSSRARVQNRRFYFREGLSWHSAPQYPSNHSRINARYLMEGSIFSNTIHALFMPHESVWEVLGYLNSELVFYLVRIFEIRKILNGTVALLPYPTGLDLSGLGKSARSAYQHLLIKRLGEECSPFFVAPELLLSTRSAEEVQQPVGHVPAKRFQALTEHDGAPATSEAALIFSRAFRSFGSKDNSLRDLLDVAWERRSHLTTSVERLQAVIDREVYDLLAVDTHMQAHIREEIAFRLCQPEPDIADEDEGVDDEDQELDLSRDQTLDSDDLESTNVSARPASNSSLESTNNKSIRKAFDLDQVCRLLSHAVRSTVEGDPDGIVPIVAVKGQVCLADRVKSCFIGWFGQGTSQTKWVEAGQIIGKPVEQWLGQDYFEYHVNMYYRRPVVWQFSSAACGPGISLPGAFSCLVCYHRLRCNTLQDLLAHYLNDFIEPALAQFNATKSVLEGNVQRGSKKSTIAHAEKAFQEADRQYRELIEFRRRIQDLDTGARPVTPAPGPDAPWLKQKVAEVTGGSAYGRGWLPVLDYGVRVNIEPLKVAGVLPQAADRIE